MARKPVIASREPPPIKTRPSGLGCNYKLLSRLDPNDPNSCIWGASKRKMLSIRQTAMRFGIRLMVRSIGDGTYAIYKARD